MPFCRFCGKEINEGETCTCEQAQAEAGKAASAAAAGAQAADALKDAAKVGSEVAGKAGVTCLEILKKPVTEGVKFVDGTNHITAIGVVVLQALLTGLFSLVLALKFNGAIKGGWFDEYKLSVVKVFFVAILFSLVASLIFAAFTFVLLKLLKLETTIYQALEIAGVRSSLLSGCIAVSVVLALPLPGWGAGLFILSGVLVSIAVYAVLAKKYEGAENKLAYGMIFATLVYIVVAAFLFSKTNGWFCPKDVDSLAELLGALLGKSLLGGLF